MFLGRMGSLGYFLRKYFYLKMASIDSALGNMIERRERHFHLGRSNLPKIERHDTYLQV